jgi:hypothetical protein
LKTRRLALERKEQEWYDEEVLLKRTQVRGHTVVALPDRVLDPKAARLGECRFGSLTT